MFVKIHYKYSLILGRSALYNMYSLDNLNVQRSWRRYRIWENGIVQNEDGSESVLPYPDSKWGAIESTKSDAKYYEANGHFVYNKSPYYVADVLDSKKYLLTVEGARGTYTVPAVKSGDKWLNLISLEEFSLDQTIGAYGVLAMNVWFIIKAYFNL